MSNIYFVHECNGERFDGTRFYWARVDYRETTKKMIKAVMKPFDVEKEFYTEHHSFQFFNTKRECEEYVQMKRESEPLFGRADWRPYDTEDGHVAVRYDYDKKEKYVSLDYKSQFGIADAKRIELKFTFDGELISGVDNWYYVQYLKALETVQKYRELIQQFTTKKEEEVI